MLARNAREGGDIFERVFCSKLVIGRRLFLVVFHFTDQNFGYKLKQVGEKTRLYLIALFLIALIENRVYCHIA